MAESGETTVIAAETQIKGELTFDGAARIIGRVEGKITAKGDLHVDQRGQCKAQIEADNVQVDGSIEGDVNAAHRVQLNAAGKIQGDVVAEKMVTAEGASIIGHVNIGAGATKGGVKATKPGETGKAEAGARVAEALGVK